MSYVYQVILFVLVLACAMMAEAFWSSLSSEGNLARSVFKSVAAGGGFIIYAITDYVMFVPGANHVIATWL